MLQINALSKLTRRAQNKFWWLDVIWPLLLAITMITGLTQLIYSGQKQMRLASFAEDALLEFSLAHAGGWSAAPDKRVLVVSVSNLDLQKFGKVSAPGGEDISSETYGKIIERLSALGAKRIYLHLAPGIHDIYPADLNPIVSAAQKVNGTTQVHLAYPLTETAGLPESVRKALTVLDNGPCREGPVMQSRCSFNPDWQDWVVQNVAQNSLPHPVDSKDTPYWVSNIGASGFPSFIVNVPHPASLNELSVESALAIPPEHPIIRTLEPGFTAFIGSATTGTAATAIKTAYDKESKTALHVYWAQIATMFLQNRSIAIPAPWVNATAAALFCIAVVIVMIFFHGPLALGFFAILVMSSPLVNAAAIRFTGVYIPLFDSHYFGLMTLLIAGFGQLSIAALQKWRIDEKRRLHAQTTDVKGNFISLLSHNLNTPIAKMQGTLSLLANQPGQGDWREDVRKAEAGVAKLELAVKSVLTSTALEDGAINLAPTTTLAFADEVRAVASGPLRRLGLLVKVEPPRGDDELLALPIRIDTKTLAVSLTALCALFADDDQPGPNAPLSTVKIRFELTEALQDSPSDGPTLICTIESEQRWISGPAIAALKSNIKGSVKTRAGQDFLTDVLAGIAMDAAQKFHGVIDLVPRGRGGIIAFLVKP